MASMAHSDASATHHGGGRSTLRPGTDAQGLAAFRALATVDYKRSLTTLIEGEIIPRLMVAHSPDAPPVIMATIEIDEVAELAALVLQIEGDALLAVIEAILARGVSVDTVMIDLLAPAARLLGEQWKDDLCDFVDVTMGLWRLQEVVRHIAARAPGDRIALAGGHSALFATMPGDQHNFGTIVIDELFRRDGWITDRLSNPEITELLMRVGSDWFDMIGLTVSCECHISTTASVIVALRNVSRNPHVCILVGGPAFSADPDQAVKVGADGTAPDAKLALKVAANLVRLREREALIAN